MSKFLVTIISILFMSSVFAQNKTLKDTNGKIMRAAPIAIGKSDFMKEPMKIAEDVSKWHSLKELGYNTVRLCWVDPWFQMNKKEFWTVNEILPVIDKCVENATASGVNLIICYHNVGEYQKTKEFGMMADFWEKVATRYKNNELVYYELNNEQAWTEDQYLSDVFKNEMKSIYMQVRKTAPERQIILFSFHSLVLDMVSIIEAYDWIDWDFTTVGWHFYGSQTGDKTIEEYNMLNLITKYRTICTEWDYPDTYDYVKKYFGYDVNSRMLEYYSISWADWRGWNDGTFDEFQNILIPDAKLNGYWWGK